GGRPQRRHPIPGDGDEAFDEIEQPDPREPAQGEAEGPAAAPARAGLRRGPRVKAADLDRRATRQSPGDVVSGAQLVRPCQTQSWISAIDASLRPRKSRAMTRRAMTASAARLRRARLRS